MIELVPITQGDKEFFRKLNEISYREVIEEQFGEWDSKFQRAAFEVKWKEQNYLKILRDGEIIGGIWVQDLDTYHQLREIQILPAHRNQNIGSNLIAAEAQRAKMLGKILRLRVLLRNPAFQLYKRLGFVVTEKNNTQYHMEYGS